MFEILLFVGLYLLLLLLVGLFCQGRVKHLDDYYLAGRKLSVFWAIPTILATWFGAGSLLGVSAAVHANGMASVLPDPFGCALALVICALFYAGRVYKAKLMTINEVLQRAYGGKIELIGAVATIPFYVGTVAAQLVAIGFLVHSFSDFSLSTSIVVAGLTVGGYTMLGGLWAVVMTDFIQLIFIVAALFALLFPIFTVPEHLAISLDQMIDGFGELAPTSHPTHGYLTYVGMLTMTGLGALMGQDLMQRIFACRSLRTAQISLWCSALVYLLLGMAVIMLGYYSRLVADPVGGSESVIFALVRQNATPLVMILFLLGMLSATMSTADSYLLAGSSIVCQGLLHLNTKNPKRALLLARLCNLLLCSLAALLALYTQDIYGLMVHSGAFLFVLLFVPVTGALYLKNPPKVAGGISLLVGFLGWLGYFLYHHQDWSVDFDALAYAAALVGATFSGVSYLLVYCIVRWRERQNKDKIVLMVN